MLDEYWTSHFGDTPPIAHRFRDLYSDQWIRFHSLPDSKRYAETETEWATLLERHNAIISELAGESTQLELLTTNWSATQTSDFPSDEFRKLQLPAEHWRTVAMHESEGEIDPNYWHVFHSAIHWAPGSLDGVIRAIADDQMTNAMILDPASSWLLHPYDGGMDAILSSRDERDRLSTKFALWRSQQSNAL